MARYELQKWITGYAIRDTADDVYLRNSEGDVAHNSLGEWADVCLSLNSPRSERESARARFIVCTGSDDGFDDEYDAELAQEEYEREWERQENERAWEEYCDAMGCSPWADAEDYSSQYFANGTEWR